MNQAERIESKLDVILETLDTMRGLINHLISQGGYVMADLTALTAQVAASVTVEQSAITLLQGLSAALAAAGTDPTKLAALQNQLNTSQSALAAAIVANTPAAPPAPPAPAPTP
jgi:hypothetical protein